MVKCEKCGKYITTVKVNEFQRDGSDHFVDVAIKDYQNNAIGFETSQNWCGYWLTEEEQAETILCPHCDKFPFKDKEIQCHEIMRVVCFREIEKMNEEWEKVK